MSRCILEAKKDNQEVKIRTVKRIELIKKIIARARKKGKAIGFVPTMGYLHEGHLSLVRIAKRKSNFVVVSIFVNPIQFGPHEDYNCYPRDLKKDMRLLKKENVDLIFNPSVKEMYPNGYKTYVEVSDLSNILCGSLRPGHFRGVITVVLKLLNIVKPDIAIFGRKDFQQAVIIEKMVKDLNLDVKIITIPTVRESDGLAMSSRNVFLNKSERKKATILYQALKWARRAYYKNLISNAEYVIKKMKAMIEKKGGRVDYVAIVDKDELKPVKKLKKGNLIALAVFFGKTRLIDNIVL